MKTNILNKNNREFGKKIVLLRQSKGWTQERLSAELQLSGLDISRATLSKIELGTRQVYYVEVKYFAMAFKMDYFEFEKFIKINID